MPLSSVLLPLCALLLILTVTAASAGAPAYGPGEVAISVAPSPGATTRQAQTASCASLGGVLVPAVTDAVHLMVTERVDDSLSQSAAGCTGGSSMSPVVTCTTSKASLNCICSWDVGRYHGVGNEVVFYKGNRDPNVLPGAGMVGTAVGDHWRMYTSGITWHPGDKVQRYGAYVRDHQLAPTWADTSDATWSYGGLRASEDAGSCAKCGEVRRANLALDSRRVVRRCDCRGPLCFSLGVPGAEPPVLLFRVALCRRQSASLHLFESRVQARASHDRVAAR